MVNKFLKKKSKRLAARTRYKIERKVREHNRKVRKEKKKGSNRKSKKDAGVPNLCPFKEKVLQEVEAYKNQRLELKQRRREAAKEQRKSAREAVVEGRRGLGDLLKEAQEQGEQFEKKIDSSSGGQLTDKSAKAYYKEFRKVVEVADVVLQVLDARDPIGTRSRAVEQAVLAAGPQKRIILLLNKSDLVPRENLEAWLRALRLEFPTIAFKASTQQQRNHLGRLPVSLVGGPQAALKSSRCLGAGPLMKLLGNYCRNKDIRTAITVGVVGVPNVGKSSIINSLKRVKACQVGATPGVTRSMQEVHLDSHVRLLDCPGLVLATSEEVSSDTEVTLRNVVKVEQLEDPVTPVGAILRRTGTEQLMLHYRLPSFTTADEFLCLLARRLGRLKKGGVPDVTTAARTVLGDWNSGKIKYYTQPPLAEETAHVSSEIVSQMAAEFDLASIEPMETGELSDLPAVRPSEAVALRTCDSDTAMDGKD